MVVADEYDPLTQAQKIVMLKNGTFEFDDILNSKCLCGHSESEHLIDLAGIADCCLFAKGNLCICDKFVEKGAKVKSKKQNGKLLPSLQKSVQEDPQINSYVQQLSQI